MRSFLQIAGKFLFIASCAFVLNINVAPVKALNDCDIEAINQDSVHYVGEGCSTSSCSVSSSGTALQGNDNIEKAWNFFIGKSLTPEQTAGLVGNFMWESGGGTTINPSAQNEIGAFGIAQWLGGRKDNLQAFAEGANKPINNLGVQLDFAWSELKGSEGAAYAGLIGVKATGEGGVRQAAQVVFDQYERAGDDTLPQRQDAAVDAYSLYGSSGGATGTPSASGCQGWTGQDTQFIDGFKIFSQCDPAWGNNSYGRGSTNICDSGCGPTAMAMIITNLTGNEVTPDKTAIYADSINMYVPNVGSSHLVGPRLAERWDLRAEKINNSVTQINRALANGGLVIVAGDGAEPFTSAGHFIVIRAVTASGMWRVGDSAHSDTSDKDWDPAAITAGVSGHESSVYAIYNN